MHCIVWFYYYTYSDSVTILSLIYNIFDFSFNLAAKTIVVICKPKIGSFCATYIIMWDWNNLVEGSLTPSDCFGQILWCLLLKSWRVTQSRGRPPIPAHSIPFFFGWISHVVSVARHSGFGDHLRVTGDPALAANTELSLS